MSDINTDALARQVRSKRGNTSLREAAKSIGDISIATLSRIEQGKDPDLSTYFKICTWLNVDADTFRGSAGESIGQVDHKEEILYHLRADEVLSPEARETLQQVIQMAYLVPRQP